MFSIEKRPNSTDLFLLFHLEAKYDSNQFFLFWWISATLEGHFREVGDLCELHNNFVKFGVNAHFASYPLFNPGSHGRFHVYSYTRSFLSTKRRSVAIYLVCIGFVVLIYFAQSDLFQALCILRHKSSEDVFKLDSELKELLLPRWVCVFVLKLFLKHVLR